MISPRIDFGDLRNHAVHELAIVRGHQQRALERFQKLLQPDDGFDVQVVGGLVHQQHVGPARAARAPAPRAFSSRPRARPRRRRSGRPRSPGHAALRGPALRAYSRRDARTPPAPRRSAPGCDPFHPRVGIFHRVLQSFEFVMQIARAAAAGDGFVEHRAALHLFHILAKVADRELLRNRDVAFVGRFLADDHAEERGFAGSVGADQPDLFAGVQLERSFDEDQLLAVLFIDVRKRNHPLARPATRARASRGGFALRRSAWLASPDGKSRRDAPARSSWLRPGAPVRRAGC